MRIQFFVFIILIINGFGVELGVDVFFSDGFAKGLTGKKVGLITNQSGVNKDLCSTLDLFLKNEQGITLAAVFAPEHGVFGEALANKEVANKKIGKVPVYSLYGKTRRPTEEMLKGLDLLIYDIQEIGSRSYTYITTLCYVMEEACKKKIPVWVLDRPNPLGGKMVDGPMLEEAYRSFIGYLDVPYCHGLTIGELACYFNGEYKIGCQLRVIPMKGWKREMTFLDTGLSWIPTSPYVPDSDTPLFYATTGLIGELGLLSIGIGYTLPFKVIGAPWLSAQEFAGKMNAQKLSGVRFVPFHFIPQYGLHKGESCQGVLIVIVDKLIYKPVQTQCFILGMLKSMYPQIIEKKLLALPKIKKELFCKAAGGEGLFSILLKEKYPAWKLFDYQKDKKQLYLEKRKKYLLYN